MALDAARSTQLQLPQRARLALKFGLEQLTLLRVLTLRGVSITFLTGLFAGKYLYVAILSFEYFVKWLQDTFRTHATNVISMLISGGKEIVNDFTGKTVC